METIKVQMKEKEVKTDSTQKKTTKKVKGKKKSKKLKQEKHYKNLKELLDDIEEEKISKKSKEKKEAKIQKEEIKIEEIPIKDCLSIYNLSVSGTTVGSLSLDGNENYTGCNATQKLKIKKAYTEVTSSQSGGSSSSSQNSEREEYKITPDGWNPREHEVSRRSIGDGRERVNYDDGYFRVVDQDGNIITHGWGRG